ncbi:hypothetical protein BD414DRAFT_496656 [Trametes punicea]|nr:hypothetical protein BD414DRAFT_496656 [Trametes punicea]
MTKSKGKGRKKVAQAAPKSSGAASSAAAQSSTPTKAKPRVLIISLEKEPYTEETYEQLYCALRKNASVTEALTTRAAHDALSSVPRFSAVLVSDAAITLARHSKLLARLISLARFGGARVVLGMQLSNHFRLDTVGAFFRKWGLNWDAGSYHRTTVALNPAGVPPPLSAQALLPSYSMKGLHLKNVQRECAVYLPTPASRVESMVFAPTPITGDRANESPAVFTRMGAGYLGFVGDVNGEQGSTRLTLEMCGVNINPGDMGSRNVTTGLRFYPGGRVEATRVLEEEVQLPAFPASASTSSAPAPVIATLTGTNTDSPSSHNLHVSSSTAASSASPAVAIPQSPPRPREAEVMARAARRAGVREQKRKRAEALKEEGNTYFRKGEWAEAAERYHDAAMIAGPQPVYMSNLAAALLNLELWYMAESAASRALMHDPGHVKARFRRAVARKRLRYFDAAEADLQRILANEPSNITARTELESVRTLKRTMPSDEGSLKSSELYDDMSYELEEESDSEDFNHIGNGRPCKFYNHDGCARGTQCRFSHAPDGKSVRDELGRNVCIYWLLGECRFGDGRCVYAHDRTYLPERGWWTDEEWIAGLKDAIRAFIHEEPLLSLPKAFLAEAAKPDWREDLWVGGGYREEAEIRKEFDDDYEDDDDDEWVDEEE